MISTPTPSWPRPFHLRTRPQLDFLRITRIRKSYGMVFLHQNIQMMHTWDGNQLNSSLQFVLCIKLFRIICLSVSTCSAFCQRAKQWIIKEEDNIIVPIPIPIVPAGGSPKSGVGLNPGQIDPVVIFWPQTKSTRRSKKWQRAQSVPHSQS